MDAVQILRALADPALPHAAQAALDTIEREPRHLATIAGLETALEAARANARPDVPDTYEVQAGDTLLKIGRAFLVQVHDIKAWNRLGSDHIEPKQVLHLTGPAPEPEPEPEAPARTLWGASVMPHASRNESRPAALARVRSAYGDPFILRDFDQPGQGIRFPTEYGTELDQCAGVVHSFKGTPQDVTAGKHDGQMRAYLTAVVKWLNGDPARVWRWSYWHEPEDDIERGAFTADQYRAAWTHLGRVAAETPHPRLKSCLILMEYTLRTPRRNWRDYYAPSAQDVIGWDVYDVADPKSPIAARLAGIRAVATETGKPSLIGEAGVTVRYGDRKPKLREFATTLATTEPRPEIVTYFESDEGHTPEQPGDDAWPLLWRDGDLDAWNAGRQ